MAWTAPRTWVAGEILTAGNMNTHVRDNLNALSTHRHTGSAGDGAVLVNAERVVKNTSQVVTVSGTVSDTTMKFTQNTSEVWQYEFVLRLHSNAIANSASGFYFGLAVPANATGVAHGFITPEGALPQNSLFYATALSTRLNATALPTTINADYIMHLYARIETSGTSGEVGLLWGAINAQSSGVAVEQGSYAIREFITTK